MNALLLLAAVTMQMDSVRICVRDQRTDAPLQGVTVTTSNRSRMLTSDCGLVVAGRMEFRRIGYKPLVADVREASTIRLSPLVGNRTVLDTQHVVASRSVGSSTRTEVSVTAEQGRERGAATVPQLVAQLPYTQLQSNRGAVSLSLRGARREQVVVTLDGIPLNDPSTGLADVAELPLSAVASANLMPGASPVVEGSGAVGGVLALHSNSTPLISARSGAFGERGLEAAGRFAGARAIAHVGASWSERRNDFRFENTVGALEVPAVEIRQNNDERRLAAFGSVLHGGLRVAAIASRTERGMVGPMNVRTYDNDRARTDRLLVDGRLQYRSTQWFANIRAFTLAYSDPTRPQLDNDARAHVGALGMNAMLGPVTLSAGAGADRVSTSVGVRQDRARGHVAMQLEEQLGRAAFTAGARVDGVEHSGVLPSFTVGVSQEWERSMWRGTLRPMLRARVSQGVRVPTLYDLYFSSPQRIVLRKLEPERTVYDAEVATGFAWQRGPQSIMLEGAMVARKLRDAIIWFPGNFSWSPANVGEEQLRGLEGRMRVANAHAHLSAWTSWYDAVMTSTDLDIPTPYVARHSAGAQMGTDISAFTLTGSVRALGRRPFTNGPRNPLYELPAVTLVDAVAAHRSSLANASMLVSATLENVFNRPWQSVHGFPEPGRRWSISLTLTPRH